jgi:hypothetical protein
MKQYIITHIPTQSFQNVKGRPVTYGSISNAMVGLIAWAKECDLLQHDFIVQEYKVKRTKFD